MYPLWPDHLYAQAQRVNVIGKINVGGDDVCKIGEVWNRAVLAWTCKGGAFFI
jgi:hypothetical protein